METRPEHSPRRVIANAAITLGSFGAISIALMFIAGWQQHHRYEALEDLALVGAVLLSPAPVYIVCAVLLYALDSAYVIMVVAVLLAVQRAFCRLAAWLSILFLLLSLFNRPTLKGTLFLTLVAVCLEVLARVVRYLDDLMDEADTAVARLPIAQGRGFEPVIKQNPQSAGDPNAGSGKG